MATLTAQLLVGHAHPNHGGINPSHYLFLSENDRPAWMLVPQHVFENDTEVEEKVIWVPTVESMLEDALLMIALHVLRDEDIIRLAERYLPNQGGGRVELYENVNKTHLKELHERNRNIQTDYKLVVTAFKDSTILRQLAVLENYRMDLEVCTPTYSRLYSRWEDRTNIEGSL